MAKLWSQLQRVAPYFRTALLTGEEGTGASVVAQTLHDASPFKALPLRVLSSSAAEECFATGGAFATGGGRAAYYFEHVETLSASAQRGLLQVLRLRGERACCVIAFTPTDLRSLVSQGRFTSDLAASLGGLKIPLPSLSERKQDIPA
ncbi:MAG: sigma 54-interacting transcriptional regulator, partial [Bryocella sp.]